MSLQTLQWELSVALSHTQTFVNFITACVGRHELRRWSEGRSGTLMLGLTACTAGDQNKAKTHGTAFSKCIAFVSSRKTNGTHFCVQIYPTSLIESIFRYFQIKKSATTGKVWQNKEPPSLKMIALLFFNLLALSGRSIYRKNTHSKLSFLVVY